MAMEKNELAGTENKFIEMVFERKVLEKNVNMNTEISCKGCLELY